MSYLYLCSPVDCRWMGGVGDVGGMNNKTISLTMQGCMLFQYGPLSVYLYVCMYGWMDGWMDAATAHGSGTSSQHVHRSLL